MPGGPGRPVIVSPLATWFPDSRAMTRFRHRRLGRRPVVLAARDEAWRALVPGFEATITLLERGLPFQSVAERRYDRTGDPRRLRRALARGTTVFVPQAHQVLPRVARLMVALRARLLGSRREESSFLFAVEGTGRAGMGLHHDGEVDAFWLQLAGRRTVTIGPPVGPGAPPDLDDRLTDRGGAVGWITMDLPPGTLFHLPPRTPHAVVCRGRSLALSLTWSRPRRPRAALDDRATPARAAWDVVSGRAEGIPPARPSRAWAPVPAVLAALDRGGRTAVLRLPDGLVRVPAAGARRLLRRLAEMPSVSWRPGSPPPAAVAALLAAGLLTDRDLPLVVMPAAPAALDGWRFA